MLPAPYNYSFFLFPFVFVPCFCFLPTNHPSSLYQSWASPPPDHRSKELFWVVLTSNTTPVEYSVPKLVSLQDFWTKTTVSPEKCRIFPTQKGSQKGGQPSSLWSLSQASPWRRPVGTLKAENRNDSLTVWQLPCHFEGILGALNRSPMSREMARSPLAP